MKKVRRMLKVNPRLDSLVEAAGYQSSAAVRFLERQLAVGKSCEEPPPQNLGFFQHPTTEKRIKALKRQLR